MFTCLHCDVITADHDAVDVSHIVAIARGSLACSPCAELLEDADADDRAAAEVRARVAYVESCAGLSLWGLRLLGIEGE